MSASHNQSALIDILSNTYSNICRVFSVVSHWKVSLSQSLLFIRKAGQSACGKLGWLMEKEIKLKPGGACMAQSAGHPTLGLDFSWSHRWWSPGSCNQDHLGLHAWRGLCLGILSLCPPPASVCSSSFSLPQIHKWIFN